MDEAAAAEVDAFYQECPASSSDVEKQIADFFRHHQGPDGSLARPVVCVTSGGTTVPMERNCVRYIDNFSAGTRGAMSTQEFLEVRRSLLPAWRIALCAAHAPLAAQTERLVQRLVREPAAAQTYICAHAARLHAPPALRSRWPPPSSGRLRRRLPHAHGLHPAVDPGPAKAGHGGAAAGDSRHQRLRRGARRRQRRSG